MKFSKHVPNIGQVDIRRIALNIDSPYIHQWVNQDYAHFWGMTGQSQDQVHDFYLNLEANTSTECFIGLVDDIPTFLIERYEPKHDEVGEHYNVKDGDIGMHILIAPAEHPISNFTFHIFSTVMQFMFDDDTIKRVVVEPDHRNHKIHQLNKRAGFHHEKKIQLGEKIAYLGFCTREQFIDATQKEHRIMQMLTNSEALLTSPSMATKTIRSDIWQRVNRLHVKKCLAELSHERIFTPVLTVSSESGNHYTLLTDKGDIEYRFRAKVLELNHWLIDEHSIKKLESNKEQPLDSIKFIIEFCHTLGIDKDKLPTYMEEISSTLYSSAYKYTKSNLSAAALTQASYQQIEAAMNEGHPSFIANNGRIGFDAIDYLNFAPETGAPIKLIYLAAHKRRTHIALSNDLTYEQLLATEFDRTLIDKFECLIKEKGLNPSDYLLMPVHPWQWFNKLASIFAADIACSDLICLGYSEDDYQAQQSIRTFFNTSFPHKHYVKTALSVLNMGFMRGLSSYYMRSTPAINDWLLQLVQNDTFIQANGFSIIREVAAIGYSNPYYEREEIGDSPYKKMLAALWRESPLPKLEPNQKLMTMASLLHIDTQGKALLVELIAQSGLSTDKWLMQYFNAYLTPLIHFFYQHKLVFMPHGENIIMVMENDVPVKVIMKDIGEEIAILNSDIQLPDEVQRISVTVPEELEILSIFTDVFDCIFRYLSAILVEHTDFSEKNFWALVAGCIHVYQQRHPQLQPVFDKHDLFANEFTLSCLNRLQLGNNQQMIDLADPAKNLKFAGTLVNPIAQYRCIASRKLVATAD
ncbi:GNAT family N-acetyltransferase [Thalassotalea fusca]